MMSYRKLAMPLLGMLLWVISIHSGTFSAATRTLLPRPLTGIGRSIGLESNRETFNNYPIQQSHLKINEKDLNHSIFFGDTVMSRLRRLETNLGWSKIHVKQGTPSHGQFIAYTPAQEAVEQGKEALIAAKATIHLMNSFCNRYKLNPTECSKFISSFSLQSTSLGDSCKKLKKHCEAEDVFSPYRSMNGECNNKNEGSRGAAFTAYKRLLYPDYLDGVQEPRRSVSKKPLPSARKISSELGAKIGMPDCDLTMAVMQWSQFIEHDLSHTASSKMVHSENTIECCASSGNNLSPRYIHPFCAPIAIPSDDVYYSKHGLDCMAYVRSIPALRSDCSFGPLDQLNQATHYLDGSQIYGSTPHKASKLRTFTKGELSVSIKLKKDFLPMSETPTKDCQLTTNHSSCFMSGDSRVNILPQLTAMHTLWLREHNRIAKALSMLNPKWDDEKLYQEARKIVIAEIQHITYHEWIPEVLGTRYFRKIEKYSKYDESVNPSVSNSFATAALRVLNTLNNGKVKLYEENRVVNMSLQLRNYFSKPNLIEEPGYLDAVIRGLATETSQKLQFSFVDDIRNNWLSNGVYGFDVLSLDIQRGRDHGLPSYTAYRSLCGLQEVHSFDDLTDAISDETIESLKKLYSSPEDIDLIVGGLSERPSSDSLFGPTLSCIVADQFLRTRRGDRYFYTNGDQPAPFSGAQTKAIQKASLARIFCDNGDTIKMMQPNVFKQIRQGNDLVSCGSIPKIDLTLWQDNGTYY